MTIFLVTAILNAEDLEKVNCTLYDLKGNEVRLSDFKGRLLILWFWTTWCPYCRRQIAGLNSIYPELKLSGIELLAINVNESKEKLSRFLNTYPMDFNILQDKDADCAFSCEVIGVPTYLLIDRKGKLKFKKNYFPKQEYKELLLN